jgi:tRNA threonylcarbamoyladenosine biosynthesis protein TsaE
VHIDLYRLRGSEELQQLGLRDYLNGHTLLLIEWPERAAGALPPADLGIRLDVSDAAGAAGRIAHVEARSSVGEAWLMHTRDVLPNQI